VTFDHHRLDLASEQLWCGSQEILLPGKAFAMLRYLVEHAGQLVSKAELFAALWPGTAVTDGALTFCIVELRKALGDNAKAPRFIETVHRRGYRFLPSVTTPPVSGSRFLVSGQNPEQRETRNEKPETHLVGREAELSQLHCWLDKALNGERQIVFVTGEPGIGKTTVVEAFLQSLASRVQRLESEDQKPLLSQARTLDPRHQTLDTRPWLGRGQCIEQYGPGEPYMPILEALGQLGREPDGERLIAVLQQHAPTWLVQMSALLSAAEREILQRQTQGATRERMLREMGDAINALAAERPLVLWLEDLHWSDASTLELLALLARRREPARLLVLGTYRPVDVIVQEHPLRAVKQELQLHGLCAELPLGLLSEVQVAEYLEQRFAVGAHGRAPLQTLAKVIHRRTDGNPLFMVTAVEDLIKQKVLVQNAEQWAVQEELAAIETRVPDNLQQLIERQIERLSAEDRRLLEGASVAGIEFSAAAVAAGVETATESVEERCEGFARQAHFLRTSGAADWPDGTVASRYSFLHALYQEVLYERIPARRRQRLHQRIGEQEEHAYGARAKEIAAELAVHFEQGRDYRKAVQYLQQAGENATQRSAYVEAITHLTTALELLKMLPDTRERAQQELTLHVTLGVPLQATRSYSSPEVRTTYTRAWELCQRVGETRQLFSALLGLRRFHLVRGEFLRARELGEQLLGLAQREQDPALLMEAYWGLGSIFFHLGEFGAAQAHLEQGLTLYDAQRHDSHVFLYGIEPGISGLCNVARVLWYLGYPDQALQKSEAARTLAQELSHPFSLAAARVYAALLHQLRRDRALTHEWAEAAITLARGQGFSVWLGLGAVLQGWAQAEQGQSEEGISQLRHGLATRQAIGAGIFHSYALALLAEAYGKAGQIEEGLSVLTEALTQVNKAEERFYEAELYRLKGELTLQRFQISGFKFQVQENQKAKACPERSRRGKGQKPVLSVAEGAKFTSPQPLTPGTQAEAEAEACFLKAIEIARKQQAKSLELRAVMSLSRLWQQQGKRAEARRMLAEIYDWFTEGFDTKDLQEAKALLEELA
jgi:DNA-binding winged helix-turn-helix (wHTH) protein/predicted ATPase